MNSVYCQILCMHSMGNFDAFLRGPYCAITNSAWHFISGSPFCVSVENPPHPLMCEPCLRTEDWTLDLKPLQIKYKCPFLSFYYLTQNNSNISCRLEYRNRKQELESKLNEWVACQLESMWEMSAGCLCVCQEFLCISFSFFIIKTCALEY